MEQNPNEQSNNRTKTVVMTATGVFLLLFVAVSVVSFFRRQSAVQQTGMISPTPSSKAKTIMTGDLSNLPSFPQASVQKWGFLGAASIAGRDTASASLFPLRSNLTRADFTRLSLKLGMQPQFAEENDERVMAGSESGQESAVLYLQKKTGSFLYKATDGYGRTSSSAAELEPQRMQEFASTLVADPTVKLAASYRKKSMPGVTYYEFYRDWSAVGLPVVSMLGLFNMPEQVKLSQLESAKDRRSIASSLKPDLDITATTDATDGRVRANDFNTITVGLKNGRVVTIVSKLRLMGDQGMSNSSVIPYVDAVKRLETNQYAQILTSPAGSGKLDHSAVYPQNKATLRSVTVTDSRLTYLEELPYTAQSQLVPHYVFRGYGVLTSGYRVDVLAAVAATQKNVLGQSQQQGTFLPDEPPSATARPTTQTPVITTKCLTPPGMNDLSNVQTGKSGMVFGQLPTANFNESSNTGDNYGGEWFMIPVGALDVQQLSDVLDTVGKRQFALIVRDYEQAAGSGCAVRISGV